MAALTQVFTAPSPRRPRDRVCRGRADAEKQLATIKQYCVACHNDRAKTGGVSFEGMTAQSIAQHADVFEKAVRKLRGRVMPPPGRGSPMPRQPIRWSRGSRRRSTRPPAGPRPDKIVLHRLNRKEYANAVRDLLAVEFDAAERAAGR